MDLKRKYDHSTIIRVLKSKEAEEESPLHTSILEFEETTLKGFIATINIGGLGHPPLLKGRIFQTIPHFMLE